MADGCIIVQQMRGIIMKRYVLPVAIIQAMFCAGCLSLWGQSKALAFLDAQELVLTNAFHTQGKPLSDVASLPTQLHRSIDNPKGFIPNVFGRVLAYNAAGEIFEYHHATWMKIILPGSARPNSIAAAGKTSLWLTDSSGNLLRFDGRNWLTIPLSSIDGAKGVATSIWVDHNDRLLLLCDRSTLSEYDGIRWRSVTLTHPHGKSITSDSYGNIWIPSYSEQSVLKYNGNTWEVLPFPSVPAPYTALIYSPIHVDRNNHLWIAVQHWWGSERDSLYLIHYNGVEWNRININATPLDVVWYTITIDSDPSGRIWLLEGYANDLAGGSHLSSYAPSSAFSPYSDNELASFSGSGNDDDVYADAQGHIWTLSNKQECVYQFSPLSFTQATEDELRMTEDKEQLFASPQPCSDDVLITVPAELSSQALLLYDATGRLLLSQAAETNSLRRHLRLRDLPQGKYRCSVGNRTCPLVIVR